jgi:hypothetical protein
LSGPSPFELGPERVLSGVETTQAEAPDVDWNGEDFLVVWSARQLTGVDLFAIRVGPYGDSVDGRPWLVSSSPGNQRRPSIAWGGVSHLVVWEDDRSGPTKIYATWVTPQGDVIEPKGFAVAESRYAQSAPVVAWTGAGFLVVWSEEVGGASGVDLYGAVVMPGIFNAAPQGLPLVIAAGDQREPAVAWGPTGGLLVWSDARSGGDESADLYAVRFDADGRRVGPADIVVSTATGAQRAPAVVWDGAQFVAFWIDGREGTDLLYGARIDDGGRLLDPAGLKVTRGPTPSGRAALAAPAPGQLIALWTELGTDQHLLLGRAWDGGVVSTEPSDRPVSHPLPGRTGAVSYVLLEAAPRLRAATTDRGELLVVWPGRRAGGALDTQIMMRLVILLPRA